MYPMPRVDAPGCMAPSQRLGAEPSGGMAAHVSSQPCATDGADFTAGRAQALERQTGKAKAQAGNLRHGRFSAEAITERRELRRVLHLARRTLRDLAALA